MITNKIGRRFYAWQDSMIPKELEMSWREFAFWGWVNDKLYGLSKFIFKFYSQKELERLEKLVNELDEFNCDFRVYEMRGTIKHGIFCNKK